MEPSRPKVGVGVIIINGNSVLMGKRKNAHGSGAWSFPGGHLEFGETVEACAEREVMEETGLRIQNLRRGTYTNDVFIEEGKHYITLYILADYSGGNPAIMEPEKCEEWRWVEWGNFPDPLFLPVQNLLKDGFVVKP